MELKIASLALMREWRYRNQRTRNKQQSNVRMEAQARDALMADALDDPSLFGNCDVLCLQEWDRKDKAFRSFRERLSPRYQLEQLPDKLLVAFDSTKWALVSVFKQTFEGDPKCGFVVVTLRRTGAPAGTQADAPATLGVVSAVLPRTKIGGKGPNVLAAEARTHTCTRIHTYRLVHVQTYTHTHTHTHTHTQGLAAVATFIGKQPHMCWVVAGQTRHADRESLEAVFAHEGLHFTEANPENRPTAQPHSRPSDVWADILFYSDNLALTQRLHLHPAALEDLLPFRPKVEVAITARTFFSDHALLQATFRLPSHEPSYHPPIVDSHTSPVLNGVPVTNKESDTGSGGKGSRAGKEARDAALAASKVHTYT
jgi:hypothetical protein